MDAVVYGALCEKGKERELARRLLELALAREYGLALPPALAQESGGKPFFPDRPDIQFNISHSHGAAVCALHDKPIGVDVERLRPAPRRIAKGLEDGAFFRLWTGKEATVKRTGKAGAAVLMGPLEPDGRCRWREDFLPGWIVCVCPSEDCAVRYVTSEGL